MRRLREAAVATLTAIAMLATSAPPVAAAAVEWPAQFLDAEVGPSAMALDKDGAAHVVYSRQLSVGPSGMFYGTNKSGSWSFSNVLLLNLFNGTDIAVDSHGAVHIVTTCLYITNRSGTWKQRSRPCPEGETDVDMAMDPLGEIHVVARSPSGNIIYSTNRRGYWLTQNLGPAMSGKPTIALDADHRVHIADGPLYLTNANGGWTAQPIPFESGGANTQVTAQGVSVRFMATTGLGLEYALLQGGAWSTAKLGPGAAVPEYVVDISGKSHVAVWNPNTYTTDYLTNASGKWKRTAGIATNVIDLAVASTGRRSILSSTATGVGLLFATSAPSPWARSKISGSTFGGSHRNLQPTLAVGADVTVKAAYTWPIGSGPSNTTAAGLRVATWNGSGWTSEYPGSPGDSDARIAVDATGHAHIAMLRPGPLNGWFELRHGTDASGSWAWTTVLDAAAGVGCPRIALGPTGHVFILFAKDGPSFDSLAHIATNRGGSWTVSAALPGTLATSPTACGSLDVDANDRVHALYHTPTGYSYVNDVTNQGAYVQKTTWSGGWDSAIAVDANAKAHALYRFYDSYTHFRYRTNETGVWVTTDLLPDLPNLPEATPAIEIGGAGPIATWSSGGALVVASKAAGAWSYESISSVAENTSLALAPDGTIWVAYSELPSTPLPSVYAFRR